MCKVQLKFHNLLTHFILLAFFSSLLLCDKRAEWLRRVTHCRSKEKKARHNQHFLVLFLSDSDNCSYYFFLLLFSSFLSFVFVYFVWCVSFFVFSLLLLLLLHIRLVCASSYFAGKMVLSPENGDNSLE